MQRHAQAGTYSSTTKFYYRERVFIYLYIYLLGQGELDSNQGFLNPMYVSSCNKAHLKGTSTRVPAGVHEKNMVKLSSDSVPYSSQKTESRVNLGREVIWVIWFPIMDII